MRVVFLDPLEARLRDFPTTYLPAPDFDVWSRRSRFWPPRRLQPPRLPFGGRPPSIGSLIEQMPNLEFLQRVGWFRARGDATAALERGIPVAVTPQGVSDRVAQHALTLTLMLIRRMPAALEALEKRLNPKLRSCRLTAARTP